MKQCRKLLALSLALSMILALAACGGTATGSENPTESSGSAGEVTASEPAAAEAPDYMENAEAVETEASTDGVASSEDGFVSYDMPLSEDGESLTIWTGSWWGFLSKYFESYEDTYFWKNFSEMTGIDFKFTIASDPWTEVQLMVASGQAYDIVEGLGTFYGGGDMTLLQSEYIYDIADLLDDAPNYNAYIHSSDEFLKNVMTDDGNICSFYKLGQDPFPYNNLWIDQTKLTEAGIDQIPETINEYHDAMAAIKNTTGNAPLWIGSTGGMPNSLFGSAYDTNVAFFSDGDGYNVYVVDGEVKFGPYEDGFKSYLEQMSNWWNDGLLYTDFMTNPSNMGGNEDAVGRGVAITPRELVQYLELSGWSNGDEWVPAPTPVQDKGDIVHLMTQRDTVAMGWYIPQTCSNLDLTLKVLDYLYSPEGVILSNYGFEGTTLVYDDDGSPTLDLDALYNTEPYTGNNSASRIWFLGNGDALGVIDYGLILDSYDDVQKAAVDLWRSNQDGEYNYPTHTSFTEAEQDRYNEISNDLITYISENMPKFILGELNFEEDYDAFVEQVDALYGQEYISLYQAAYDRYIAR